MSKNCQTGEFSIRGETLAQEEKENLGDTFFGFPLISKRVLKPVFEAEAAFRRPFAWRYVNSSKTNSSNANSTNQYIGCQLVKR